MYFLIAWSWDFRSTPISCYLCCNQTLKALTFSWMQSTIALKNIVTSLNRSMTYGLVNSYIAMSPTERSAQFFSNIAHVVTHMSVILYATAVLHLPGEFGLAYGEMLGFASLGLILYGVAALPAGWFGDRWSQVGMMIVFFFGTGLACIVVGLSRSANQLFVGLSLIGLFAAIYHPVGIAWLIASASRRGISMGINGLSGGVGSAIAAPFVGLMIDYATWRYAFILPGLLSVMVGMLMWLGWRQGRVEDVKADRQVNPKPSTESQVRVFLVLTLTMACAGFVYAGLTNTMPKLFELNLHSNADTSYTKIGFLVGGVIGLASLSSLLGGWLADRFSPTRTYLIFWLLTIGPLFFITSAANVQLIVLVCMALSFNTGFAAAENMLVANYTPFKWRSVAYASKFVLALGIGGLTVHLAGYLFDLSGGFSQLYLYMGIAAVVASATSLLLPFGVQGERTKAVP